MGLYRGTSLAHNRTKVYYDLNIDILDVANDKFLIEISKLLWLFVLTISEISVRAQLECNSEKAG